MNEQERGLIDGLFQRLSEAEAQAGPRDKEAEKLIGERMAKQPNAAYMLAQVVLVQEQGLQNLNRRVEQLEGQLAERPQSGGGFLGGLFGGAPTAAESTQPAGRAAPTSSSGWNNPAPTAARSGARAGGQPGAQGSGFMAGAMQTAMGVAGGVLLANAVTGLFAEEAEAAPSEAEASASEADSEAAFDEPASDEGGGLFDGLFGGDDEMF